MKNNAGYVFDQLNKLGIPFQSTSHQPVMTMADCKEIGEKLGAPFCKNLFLANRQQTEFYLLMIDESKKFRTADVSKKIGTARLSFGDETYLFEYLGVTPGAITPMGLFHDVDKKVRLIVDKDLLHYETICVHACVNTESLAVAVQDLHEKLFPATNHVPMYIEVQ